MNNAAFRSPEVVEFPDQYFVGLEASFIHVLSPDVNSAEIIGPLWEQFCGRMSEFTNRLDEAWYGVIYGRPEAARAHEHELQYIAGGRITADAAVLEGMVRYHVRACTFAVFEHHGPIANIGETCRYIYREWLPQSKYRHADIADIEVYDERFHPENEDSVMEYRVSICPDE